MAQENVVVVRFTEPSKAYQALSVLKECDSEGRIGLESAAVVERTAQGELRIPESADNAIFGPMPLTEISRSNSCCSSAVWNPKS